MRILLKEPKQPLRSLVIDGSLKTLQDLVGGNIEPITLNGRSVLLVNEEGKLNGLEPNFFLPARNDMIVGTALFVGTQGEEFTDISQEDADTIGTFMTYLVGLWPSGEE